MTRNEALQIAMETINACDLSSFTTDQQNKITDAMYVITAMRAQLSKPKATSPEAAEKRKAATAAARTELVNKVAPIIRKHLTSDMTAKDIYAVAAPELPTDFNWQKVQAILLREMKDEVVKTEAKNKANVYRLK